MLPDGLVSIEGPERTVGTLTARASRIMGIRPEDVLGHDVLDVLPLRDADGNSWWDVASPWTGLAIRTGHRERLLYLPNGREVLITARYIRARHLGPVIAVLLGVRDAEGRRRAEAEHAELISTLAHELRSPLTGVKGFSSTLLRHWERFTDDQKRLMIETIDTDADRVTRLITELLDVSRIDARRLQIHARPVPVQALLDRHAQRLAANGSSLMVSVDGCEGTIWGDLDRLEQMLGNGVDNAVRFAQSRISLGCQPGPDGTVDLLIDDDGPGVPVDRRELIFRKFTHGRAPGSTGLGLYIVRGLAEAQGGSASIEDSPLGGARLRLRLPTPPS